MSHGKEPARHEHTDPLTGTGTAVAAVTGRRPRHGMFADGIRYVT